MHIGHGALVVIALIAFLMGYFYKISKIKEWLFIGFLPILFCALILKVLWTGGLYSPFLLWPFLLTFQTLYWARSRFSKFFIPFVLFVSVASLFYYIQLNQMNFAHMIFKLSAMNYMVLYVIPFLSLSLFFIVDLINLNQYYLFQSSFSIELEKLSEYLKLMFDLEAKIEVLSNSKCRMTMAKVQFNQNIHTHLAQLQYTVESHFEDEETISLIVLNQNKINK